MPLPLLQITKLDVRYQPGGNHEVAAVSDVDLCVNEAEVVSLIGESGSGKSTLAAAIMRLLPRASACTGNILFEGCDLLSMHETQLHRIRGKRISIIPQDPTVSLNPVLRVGTQVSEVLRAHSPLDRKERKQRVCELLAEVGVEHPKNVASAYPHELSGGQRQRVVIAQAIACCPALVIADEPTSKLDSPLQVQIIALMQSIVRRHATALLWITHDPASLAGFADRIAVMYRGQMVECGETGTVFNRPRHPHTQRLIESAGAFALA